jgi:hypothetical protein
MVADAMDIAADGLLDEVFAVLRENNIAVGLKLKREIMERVEKKLAVVATTEKED